MIKPRIAKSIAVAVTVLVMAGCSLSPEPISQCDRAERIAQDKENMFANQEPVRSVVTLSEAMARALKYNLELRLKTADSILARSDYSVTRYDMLPEFVGGAGYLSRSNEAAVKRTPQSSLLAFSEDRHRRVADLQLTWNILDFGVSYIQAKQEADQFLISLERRRKMEQDIMHDVRYAYFRAVSAQKAIRKINPLLDQIDHVLSKSKNIEKQKSQASLAALRDQKTLLSTLRELTTLRRELADAKRELAALMNLAPGQRFVVSESIDGLNILPRNFPMGMSRLEYLALQHRPEVREEDYRTRMSANEIRKAKLRMFPGLEATAGFNYDSNGFLVNTAWANYGAQLTWNLMRIFSGPANIERAKRELLVANVRRMALSMAILTQVDVAYLRFRETRKELGVSKRESIVARRIYERVAQDFDANKQSQMELITAKTEMILTELRYDLIYAEWQNSAGQLLGSVGYDLLPIVDTTQPVQQLQRQLHIALNTEPTWLLRANTPGIYKSVQQKSVKSSQVATTVPMDSQKKSLGVSAVNDKEITKSKTPEKTATVAKVEAKQVVEQTKLRANVQTPRKPSGKMLALPAPDFYHKQLKPKFAKKPISAKLNRVQTVKKPTVAARKNTMSETRIYNGKIIRSQPQVKPLPMQKGSVNLHAKQAPAKQTIAANEKKQVMIKRNAKRSEQRIVKRNVQEFKVHRQKHLTARGDVSHHLPAPNFAAKKPVSKPSRSNYFELTEIKNG